MERRSRTAKSHPLLLSLLSARQVHDTVHETLDPCNSFYFLFLVCTEEFSCEYASGVTLPDHWETWQDRELGDYAQLE